MRTDTRILGALLVVASTLGAQGTANCVKYPRSNSPIIANGRTVGDTVEFKASTGSGFLDKGNEKTFGITGYRCPMCEMKREPGHRPEYSFLAEPVVESVNGTTPVKPGDVIEAVNGQPITSSAGSTQFVYPPGGAATLTVRRGRDRLVLSFTLAPPCPDSLYLELGTWSRRLTGTIDSTKAGSPKQPQTTIRVGGAVPPAGPMREGPIYVIDGVVVGGGRYDPPASAPATHFGFGLSCTGECGQLTIPDGTTYFRYSVAPRVSEIRDGSLAAAAGLKVGDVIVKVEGHSILDDEGALALARSEKKDSLRLTVLRDGKEVEVVFRSTLKTSFGLIRRP